jgi:hypothetical protein
MFDHNGKQYAGIQFYFIVFPYKAGKFTVPAITVHATTPPEGSSESKRITIKTPIQHYTVKSIPDNIQGNWFVAKSVSIQERWNKSLSHLKVGDVIERTVTVHARGTLPQFIPALSEKTLAFANVYPQSPELRDTRDDYDANGELTQSFIYLLEKEGDFVIPPMTVQWWNSSAGKLNTRSLGRHTIHVNGNPDLGLMATIQDSLANAQKNMPPATAKKKPFLIWGIHWYWFAVYVLTAAVILHVLVRLLIKMIRWLRKKYFEYRVSEKYWFRRMIRSPGDVRIFWQRLYAWWDHVNQKNKTPDILRTQTDYSDTRWKKMLDDINVKIYHGNSSILKADFTLKRRVRAFRRWLLSGNKKDRFEISNRQRKWMYD